MTIIPDLGNPQRVWELFRYPNWSSPLVWDIVIIVVYFAFAVTDLDDHEPADDGAVEAGEGAAGHGVRRPADRRAAALDHRVDLRPADLAAVVEHGADGAALRHLGDPVGHRAHRARGARRAAVRPDQAAGRDVAGARGADGRRRSPSTSSSSRATTSRSSGATSRASGRRSNTILPGGSWQALFWLEWIVGGLVPFVLLVVPRFRKRFDLLALAAVLVMVGVYAFRIELVVGGMLRPLAAPRAGQRARLVPARAGPSSSSTGSTTRPGSSTRSSPALFAFLALLIIVVGYRWLRPVEREQQA